MSSGILVHVDWQQIVALFILAIPIACITRTVVFEDVFREPREWCAQMSEACRGLMARKFFYLFTCEYCFSHWVTFFFLIITRYKLLFPDWRGYLIAFFSLVFVANAYLNLYSRLRIELTSGKVEIKAKEKQIERLESSDGAEQSIPSSVKKQSGTTETSPQDSAGNRS